MKTSLHASALRRLIEEYSIELDLSDEQSRAIDENSDTSLSENQIDFIVDQLVAAHGLDSFLTTFSKELEPISLSLYVINDRLWKMMEKKPWDTDKMLAMSTIPLCTWDKDKEKTSNPKAVKRWNILPNTLSLSFQPEPSLLIMGEGGDFSGFIEQSQLTMRKFGMMDSRKLIPHYGFEKLGLRILLKNATYEEHPKPRDDIDYDYSENARAFFEHGMAISIPGENVILKVSKRKPAKMFGEAYILIGVSIAEDQDHYRGLMADIWIRAFQRRFGGI